MTNQELEVHDNEEFDYELAREPKSRPKLVYKQFSYSNVTLYRSRRNIHFAVTVRTLSQSTNVRNQTGEKIILNTGKLKSIFVVA